MWHPSVVGRRVFLHGVLDSWAHRWRWTRPRGRMVVMRYRDDLAMGFRCALAARCMLDALRSRLGRSDSTLQDAWQRPIEFGLRPSASSRSLPTPRLLASTAGRIWRSGQCREEPYAENAPGGCVRARAAWLGCATIARLGR